MANGDCVVGAANKANIENLQKELGETKQVTSEKLKCIDSKVDKLLYLVIAALIGIAANFVY